MTDQRKDSDEMAADNDIRLLLELAGPRVNPPVDVEARVRDATMDAWEAMAKPSRLQHPIFRVALAASILVALIAGFLGSNLSGVNDSYVAEIVFASGGYSVRNADSAESPKINGGSIVQTSSEGRLLLAMAQCATVRVDQKTSLTLHASSEIWLHSGRIYVDSGDDDCAVQVMTSYATITDVGTQFEVTAQGEHLRVAIREGQIELKLGEKRHQAKATPGKGEVLQIEGLEVISRATLSTLDEQWQWTQLSRPKFNLDLDGVTVYDYLKWAARESGRTLKFASPSVRQQAATHKASGLVDPQEVDQFLSTDKNFQRLEGLPHELIIGFRSAQ